VTSNAQLLALVANALKDVEDANVTTSSVLRKAIRIATLRNDVAALLWMETELHGIGGRSKEELQRRRAQLAAAVDPETWARMLEDSWHPLMRRRRMSDSEKVHSDSISEIEDRIAMLELQIDALAPPPGLAPVDLYFLNDRNSKLKSDAMLATFGLRTVLSRTRNDLHEFLVQAELQLYLGQTNADIFERTRAFVDARIGAISPEALEQFKSAHGRLRDSSDLEAQSHALLSCRRILKTLADTLYPARAGKTLCSDGKERELNDARYLNRLVQFVAESVGKHGSGEVTQSTLEALGRRLSALDGLASKGVHDSVSADEVDACIIQTYLMVGELLRYQAGQVVHESDLVLDEEVAHGE
jgi:hypothetical protein